MYVSGSIALPPLASICSFKSPNQLFISSSVEQYTMIGFRLTPKKVKDKGQRLGQMTIWISLRAGNRLLNILVNLLFLSIDAFVWILLLCFMSKCQCWHFWPWEQTICFKSSCHYNMSCICSKPVVPSAILKESIKPGISILSDPHSRLYQRRYQQLWPALYSHFQ